MQLNYIQTQVGLRQHSISPSCRKLVADPGFRPGFRQVRARLRHAHDKLTTFRVEKLVADVIDLSRHVVIDQACLRHA